MELNEDIKKAIDTSVLCWLATTSEENQPNVSPKECFTYFENSIIIANIASPQSLKNMRSNPLIALSFIDILVQKGYQIKGIAEIIDKRDPDYERMKAPLEAMTDGKFPFSTITKIRAIQAKAIIAPSYFLYPDTNEEQQIENAKRTYGL